MCKEFCTKYTHSHKLHPNFRNIENWIVMHFRNKGMNMHESPSPTLSEDLYHIFMTTQTFSLSHFWRLLESAVIAFITADSTGLSIRLQSEGEKGDHTLALPFTGNCMPSQTLHLKTKQQTTIRKERKTWKSPPQRFYSWQDKFHDRYLLESWALLYMYFQ